MPVKMQLHDAMKEVNDIVDEIHEKVSNLIDVEPVTKSGKISFEQLEALTLAVTETNEPEKVKVRAQQLYNKIQVRKYHIFILNNKLHRSYHQK